MDKDKMPQDLDVFLSLLGEVDIIKNQLGMLDKNTHITLAQDNVSAVLGNSECFRILKLVEMLNANIAAINGALLGAAEVVTTQFAPDSYSQTVEDKKESSSGEEQVAMDEEDSSTKDPKEKKDNEVINNIEIISTGGSAKTLREAGLRTLIDYDRRSAKSQMKRADRAGARYVVIVGGDELARGEVTLKDMTTGEQKAVTRESLPKLLKTTEPGQ